MISHKPVPKRAIYSRIEVGMQKTIYLALFRFLLMTCPVVAQEVYVHGGATSRTDSSNGSYAWGLTYLQGLRDLWR